MLCLFVGHVLLSECDETFFFNVYSNTIFQINWVKLLPFALFLPLQCLQQLIVSAAEVVIEPVNLVALVATAKDAVPVLVAAMLTKMHQHHLKQLRLRERPLERMDCRGCTV